MTVYTVGSTAELTTVMRGVRGGDTVLLKSGTYSDISLRNIKLTEGVTITSADPANRAVLKDFLIRDSSGITISNVEMATSAGNHNMVYNIYYSNNIRFDHVEVHGPSGLGDNNTISPFGFRESTNVSVTNSEFYNLQHGLGIGNSTGVTITGNYFHHMRTDGIRGGGNSDVLIKDNYFTNFFPAAADHADAIQLWTLPTTKAASNITITGNLVLRGEGQPMQGVFVRDGGNEQPFKNLTISNNLVIGGNHNGIAVEGVVGGSIVNNTVLGLDGHRSWIRVLDDRNFSIDGNRSTFFMPGNAPADLVSNTLMQEPTDSGAAALNAWLAARAGFVGAWGNGDAVVRDQGLAYTSAMANAASAAPSNVLVAGTAGDDKLKTVANFDSRLEGGAGNDSLTGAATKTNQLVGGDGDDNYGVVGTGDLVIELAGQGIDTVTASIDYTLGANVENLRLKAGGLTGTGNELDNRITGSAGDDRIFGMAGDDLIQGLDGNDQIWGGQGGDDLRADGGDDIVFGEGGDDTILGGLGNDRLDGGAGNDVIEGGAGNDWLTGGAGGDSFVFRAADVLGGSVDTITDLVRGQDKINLKAIDARLDSVKDDAFTFIGTADFHKVAGELKYQLVGGNAVVSGDVNGDGVADFSIVVQNMRTMLATDFML